ncbi:MAG: hypothetical protein Q9175_000929 [Cornicularia normoerica]
MVNLRTLNSPHRDTVFNALPSQNLQQVGESVARRPSTKSAVAHADTMVYLENISKQPTYSLMKPIMAMSQMRLDSSTDGHSDAVPEGLPKLKDYRRGIFVGKSGYGQVFRHESRHSSEVFAVKVVAFPEIIPAGRKNIKGKTAELFDRKMAYIKREADILLKLDHRLVLRAHQVFHYSEGVAVVMPYFEDGELGSLAEFPPYGKTWPLLLSDAGSINNREYNNGRDYDELFGDKIRKAIDSSDNLAGTIALIIGQMMAAYTPTRYN